MTPKLNPFYPNDPIPPSLFVGRQKEVNMLTRAMEQTIRGRPESILIVGPRASGKTSLALYAADKATSFSTRQGTNEESVLPVLVRCGGASSIYEICTRVIREVHDTAQGRGSSIVRLLRDAFKQFSINVGPLSLQIDAPERDVVENFHRLLRGVWNQRVQKQHGALQLLLDETDDIALSPAFPGFIKNTIESLQASPSANIQFVVNVVDERLPTIVKHHGSFPRIFHVANLLPLTSDEVGALIRRCLEDSPGMTCTDEFVTRLTIYSAGIPNYVHQFAHSAFEVDTDGTLDVDDLSLGATGTRTHRGAFDVLWEKHFQQRYSLDLVSPFKRKILHTMSLFDEPSLNREISSLYQEIFNEAPSSNLSVYLKYLINDGVVTRYGKSSPYTYDVSDPGFKVLLRFHPDANPQVYARIQNHMMREHFAQQAQRALNPAP